MNFATPNNIFLGKRNFYSKLKKSDGNDLIYEHQDPVKKIHLNKIHESDRISNNMSGLIFRTLQNKNSEALANPNSKNFENDDHFEVSTQDDSSSKKNPKDFNDTHISWRWTPFKISNLKSSLNKIEMSSKISYEDIKITFNKPFMYNSKLGWNWHKGWNLPNIKIQIEKKKYASLISNARIQVKLDAIISTSQINNSNGLKYTKLNGQTMQNMSKGKAIFYGAKFTETSFKNSGSKFYLIIILYLKPKSNKKSIESMEPQELMAFKSPLIFVDSRKASRDTYDIKKQKMTIKYLIPFQPTQLFKSIEVKADNKYEQIQNTLDGLCQYLGSNTLKNKIKHPLYLLFKFSDCIHLYYNSQIIYATPYNTKTLEFKIIEELQNILWSLIDNNVDSNKYKYSLNDRIPSNDTKFYLLIEDQNEQNSFQFAKKISENLEVIENEKLLFTFNRAKIPDYFQKISTMKLAEEYIGKFKEIQAIKNSEKSKDWINNSSIILASDLPEKVEMKFEKLEDLTESQKITPNVTLNTISMDNNLGNQLPLNLMNSQNLHNLMKLNEYQPNVSTSIRQTLNFMIGNHSYVSNTLQNIPNIPQFTLKNHLIKATHPFNHQKALDSISLMTNYPRTNLPWQNQYNNYLTNSIRSEIMAKSLEIYPRSYYNFNNMNNAFNNIPNLRTTIINQNDFSIIPQQNNQIIDTSPLRLWQIMNNMPM